MTELARLCGVMLPLILALSAVASAVRGIDAAEVLAKGAASGLKAAAKLIPTLLGLLVGVYMLRACGVFEPLGLAVGRLFTGLGIPGEIAPLLLLRPFSGSGSLAAAAELMENCGPDSLAGRTAAVMLGSSETTIYVANICLKAAGVRKSGFAIPVALAIEFAAAAASCAIAVFMWG
ncbi:MAG: spore maturation protein [Clostridia bacterium]|nr:spore maturation protein [Clostridia bacterium]